VTLLIITLPRGCRHPDEAWEVIKFINSQEGMEYLCGAKENNGGQGKLTPFKENSPGWVEQHTHPHLRAFIELAKSRNAVSTPKLAVWMAYRDELSAAFDRVWLGQATPEEALRTVQERIQPKLDRALLLQRIREGGR
jgi:ABC-type glycerol-3-phosphate transport system substrate-binding protein